MFTFFQISGGKTRQLLNEFKWDSAKLLETILEGGNLLKNACLHVPLNLNLLICEICIDIVGLDHLQILECNHRFCDDCLTSYLAMTIKDSGLITNAINCPGFQCKYELEDDFVLTLLEKEEQLRVKYLQIIANSFVQVINQKEFVKTMRENRIKIG